MSHRGEEPRHRGASGKSPLQEKVATFYYALGLLCSTYPVCVLIFALLVILGCCLPLGSLPFPSNSPQQEWISINNISSGIQPFCYIQQITVKAAVLPWESELNIGDAFRGPLYESFKVLEIVRNYEDPLSQKALGNVCLHIEAVTKNKKGSKDVFPQYSCLVLSPANFWYQDVHEFSQDSSILTTIFNHHNFQKGKISTAEMLFGMHLYDTGIKRYPMRNRQRIIQFAITLFFKEYDEEFVHGLQNKLKTIYPLYQNISKHNNLLNDTVLIYYPGEVSYIEIVPLIFSFILLFFYHCFNVRKIEVIKSKIGMAFVATFTVFCSLCMTMGICFFFGLTLGLQGGKGMFPYLAILVGLENVLVLTKSVVTVPLHLDVKIRVAQGLSKEGWSITKNIFLEITIFTFGLFTFVPAIQEFCIFAIVSLITDFFLQMFFFITILGIDIARMSNSIEKTNQSFKNGLFRSQTFHEKTTFQNRGMSKSKSHPRLSNFPANIVAPGQKLVNQEKKLPKRLRLVNIWARTRFFQRCFMILMIIWICMIAYNSDIINNYVLNVLEERNSEQNNNHVVHEQNYTAARFTSLIKANTSIQVNYVTYNPLDIEPRPSLNYNTDKLKHPEYTPSLKLSSRHWMSVLKKYNVSLSGQTIAVLPNIKLSHVISPEEAILLRNPNENFREKFHWQALAAALDPIDFTDDAEQASNTVSSIEQPFYPTSPMEILLTTILCVISVIVLAYIFVLLYRCICSRNYAEWRASWFSEKSEESSDEQVLLEAVPVVLEGHQQEIECIATDGVNFVSACLGGRLKIWDNNTGELVTYIDRKIHFIEDSCQDSLSDETSSDYESGSPPTKDEYFPKLINKINTNFSHLNKLSSNSIDTKYEFNKAFRYYYFNYDYYPKVRNRYESKMPLEDSKSKHGLNETDTSRFKEVNDRIDSNNPNHLLRELSDSGSIVSNKLSPIWCIDYLDNLIAVGCADGRIEFWEGTSGVLKCVFEDGKESGITSIKIIGSRVIAAHLCGTLNLFQLQTYTQGRPVDWNFTCAYRRTHIRTGSMDSISKRELDDQGDKEDLQCVRIMSCRAHQQPITCLDSEGGRILTGSQDHTLKVYRLEDGALLYTLHGHCGPITCLFIDRICSATSGSGSQDGMLCVWDLLSGACMYSIQAHDGCIMSLTYSSSYVISLGMDERLCVWERFQGHHLNTIHVGQVLSSHILMLAPHLVVTGRSGGLVIWDVRNGECVRTISLGRAPFVFVNHLILLRDAVLCDYGKQLRIVRFPLITHKFD